MDGLRAIQTRYRGHLFRSRLEARWALFFDTIKVQWEYEREGYDLAVGKYLPDFWLEEQGCFVEIKPAAPNRREIAVARSLCAASRKSVFVFIGSIVVPIHGRLPTSAVHFYPVDSGNGVFEVGTDDDYRWCQCHFCERYGICFGGRSNRLPCKRKGCLIAGSDPDRGCNDASQSLIAAYEAAASARFETERRQAS